MELVVTKAIMLLSPDHLLPSLFIGKYSLHKIYSPGKTAQALYTPSELSFLKNRYLQL